MQRNPAAHCLPLETGSLPPLRHRTQIRRQNIQKCRSTQSAWNGSVRKKGRNPFLPLLVYPKVCLATASPSPRVVPPGTQQKGWSTPCPGVFLPRSALEWQLQVVGVPTPKSHPDSLFCKPLFLPLPPAPQSWHRPLCRSRYFVLDFGSAQVLAFNGSPKNTAIDTRAVVTPTKPFSVSPKRRSPTAVLLDLRCSA